MCKNKSWLVFWDFFIPVLLLSVLTVLFRTTNLDLSITEHFFYPGLRSGFRHNAYPWIILYKFGMLPAFISFFFACIIFVMSYFYRKFKKYRLRSLFVIMLMVISPGIIVEGYFKHNWGRPRPKECIQFHGDYKFKKVWTPSFSTPNCKSFPSGHATMAFFMFFPFFLYRAYQKKKKAVLWLFIGLIYGCIMSYARILQGGHFASDCLWGGGFDYLAALILYYSMNLKRDAMRTGNTESFI